MIENEHCAGIRRTTSVAESNAFVLTGRSDSHCGVVKGNQRLTPEQQRAVGLAYIAGFFRNYIGGENFASQFTGDVAPTPNQTFVMYQAPDLFTTRRDVNRLLTAADFANGVVDRNRSGHEFIGHVQFDSRARRVRP